MKSQSACIIASCRFIPSPTATDVMARLMADLLAIQPERERFSWGRTNLRDAGAMRARYIAALRKADRHDIGPLLEFARA